MLAGRPSRSKARSLTDEELLARLRAFGIEMDRSSLKALCMPALSAQEVAEGLIAEHAFKSRGGVDIDWIWICVDALWQRWLPDEPSFEMLDDKMQAGYEPMMSGDSVSACRVWMEAWDDMLRLRAKSGAKTISEFDDLFKGSQSLFNWVQSLELELGNAGPEDPRFLVRRIEVCEKALEMFDTNDPITVGNFRRGIAEAWFGLGEHDKTDRLYREWLKADPQWGWGWIGWSDCYRFARKVFQDLSRAEEILREGMKIPGVDDFKYLADRLISLYRKEGRNGEAEEVQRQADRHESEVRATDKAASVRHTIDFGDEGLPLDRPPRLSGDRPVAASGNRQKVGRNDPCPCGSGKKFKKCCGQ